VSQRELAWLGQDRRFTLKADLSGSVLEAPLLDTASRAACPEPYTPRGERHALKDMRAALKAGLSAGMLECLLLAPDTSGES
jgi:hypothetical protein